MHCPTSSIRSPSSAVIAHCVLSVLTSRSRAARARVPGSLGSAPAGWAAASSMTSSANRKRGMLHRLNQLSTDDEGGNKHIFR